MNNNRMNKFKIRMTATQNSMLTNVLMDDLNRNNQADQERIRVCCLFDFIKRTMAMSFTPGKKKMINCSGQELLAIKMTLEQHSGDGPELVLLRDLYNEAIRALNTT